MDAVTFCTNLFKKESEHQILEDEECQFLANLFNEDNRKNDRCCGYISAEEIKSNSRRINMEFVTSSKKQCL